MNEEGSDNPTRSIETAVRNISTTESTTPQINDPAIQEAGFSDKYIANLRAADLSDDTIIEMAKTFIEGKNQLKENGFEKTEPERREKSEFAVDESKLETLARLQIGSNGTGRAWAIADKKVRDLERELLNPRITDQRKEQIRLELNLAIKEESSLFSFLEKDEEVKIPIEGENNTARKYNFDYNTFYKDDRTFQVDSTGEVSAQNVNAITADKIKTLKISISNNFIDANKVIENYIQNKAGLSGVNKQIDVLKTYLKDPNPEIRAEALSKINTLEVARDNAHMAKIDLAISKQTDFDRKIQMLEDQKDTFRDQGKLEVETRIQELKRQRDNRKMIRLNLETSISNAA